MATGSSSRDVKMTLSVDTLGVENVTKLHDEVVQLGTVGKSVAPEFQHLADEISKLGQQGAALKVFQQLSADTEALAANQTQAAAASADLRVKLTALEQVQAAAVVTQKAAAAALNEATVATRANRDAAALLALEIKKEGDATEAQVAQQNSLKASSISLRAEKERAADELRSSNVALRDAAAATEKLSVSYKFAEAASKGAAAAFQANATALAQAKDTAKALAVDTDNVAASQARLVQSFNASGNAAKSAFQTQVAESRTLLQAEANVRSWQIALAASEAQVKETAAAAAAAGQKIKDAFGTLGVRGVEDLRNEITQVRAAMETVRSGAGTTGAALSGAFSAGEAKIRALELEIRKVSGALTTADKTASIFSNSLGQIAAGNIVADGVGYLVNKVKELGRSFLEAVVQGDQMRRGLTAIYGDAGLAAQQIDFLRKSSSESGVAFGQLGGEFVKFSASMKSANIPLEQSNALFKALTAASATLGLGTDATAGALNALGQIASKGTVSLEELRQQLGDRLPGVLGLTAKGFGITEAQLIKLVESGNLAARDFIGPFTKGLQTMGGETDGLVSTFDRLKGALTGFSQAAGEAGVTDVLIVALKTLGGLVGGLAFLFSALIEHIFFTIKVFGVLAASAVTLTNPLQALSDIYSESTDRLVKQGEALTVFLVGTNAASGAAAKQELALQANTAAVVKSTLANTELGAAQKLSAVSAALQADATLDVSAKIIKFLVISGELLKSQEAQTEAFDKSAKAAKIQGDTLVALADIRGQDAEKIKAQVEAATLYSVALDKSATSQAAETATLIAQKNEIEANAKARGLNSDAVKVQIDKLNDLIVKSTAETEAHAQAAAAAKLELEARQLAAETYKDNTLKIGEFTLALARANKTVEEYQRLALNGKVTDDRVTEAKRAQAVAQAKLTDTLEDSIKTLDRESRAKGASIQLEQGLLAVKEQQLLTTAKQLRASGDILGAIEFEISAKQTQIKSIELTIRSKNLEAEADLAAIAIKRRGIPVGDALAKQKNDELDIRVKLIKVKQTEVGLSLEAIKGIEAEISALRRGDSARGQSQTAIRSDTASRDGNTQRINSQTDALVKQGAAKSSLEFQGRGRTPSDGKPGSAETLEQKRINGTLSAADLQEAQALFNAARSNEQFRFGNGTAFDNQGVASVTTEQNRATSILDTVQGIIRQQGGTTGQPNAQPLTQGQPGGQQTGATRTININIGGRTTPVNVSSQADADALTAVLRQLESAKRTS